MEIEQFIGGFTQQEEAIIIYKMTNSSGNSVQLCNIGASVMGISVKDKNGELTDVVLGYKDPKNYFNDSAYLGKTPGRFSNRIALGKFTLEGKEYTLKQNNGCNHLHGGIKNFAEQLWLSSIENDKVVFQLTSPDMQEGYPGQLNAEVVYSWSEDNELSIELLAETDKTTVVNLTNHTYFNLNGENSGSVLENKLTLNASRYLPTDKTQIPTGELSDVKGTPMDFTQGKTLGQDIDQEFTALEYGFGYDHCWVIDNFEAEGIKHVGSLEGNLSGIKMDIYSTQVGVQVYSGNFLQGIAQGKSSQNYKNREGVAIECQGFPDSPNHSNFPSSVLEPGERYDQIIKFKFS
ncbi:MAG: aldose epimerase family protein [Rikenellaceae bacterium]